MSNMTQATEWKPSNSNRYRITTTDGVSMVVKARDAATARTDFEAAVPELRIKNIEFTRGHY